MSDLIVVELSDGPLSAAQQVSLSEAIVRWFAAEIIYQRTRSCCQHQVCRDVRAEAVRGT